MGRTPQEETRIQHRRKQVADLHEKGSTQAAIARELDVSQATISSDIKAIYEEWKESRARKFDEAREEQLKKLKLIAREAWKGWERSQKPAETTRIVQKNGERRAEKMVRERSGDPQFLRVVLSACEKYCKLLGLDEAASTTAAQLDKEAIRKKAYGIFWDVSFDMDNNSSKPEVIDDEYIKRLVDEKLE